MKRDTVGKKMVGEGFKPAPRAQARRLCHQFLQVFEPVIHGQVAHSQIRENLVGRASPPAAIVVVSPGGTLQTQPYDWPQTLQSR